jgi:hypothetical protein
MYYFNTKLHVCLQAGALPLSYSRKDLYFLTTNLENVTDFTFLGKIIVSMSGIGPLSKAYESFVLPLNYTDNDLEYNRKMTK